MGMWRTIMDWLLGDSSTTRSQDLEAPKFSQAEIDAATWFQQNFRADAEKVLEGTPFPFALALAIAMQETSYMWTNFYKNMTPNEVLALCVGDTLDAPNRSAFPKNKSALLAATNGSQMF